MHHPPQPGGRRHEGRRRPFALMPRALGRRQPFEGISGYPEKSRHWHPFFPDRRGPLPDGVRVGIEGRVRPAFLRPVRQHEGEVELPPSATTPGGRRMLGGSPLLVQDGWGDPDDGLPIRHGRNAACPEEACGVDP